MSDDAGKVDECTIEDLIDEITAVVSDGFPFGYPCVPPERCGDVIIGLKLLLLSREEALVPKDPAP